MNPVKEEPTFPAKLLLFGEYSVLVGSDAFAVPFEKFSGKLISHDNRAITDPLFNRSNLSLKQFLAYLQRNENIAEANRYLHLDRLAHDIGQGLVFDSSIPENYGVGSSGALVAAIYYTYRKTDPDSTLMDLRKQLAFLESAFHKESSGTDPLVSYLNKPVFIRGSEIICPDIFLDEIRKHININLIDSRIQSFTKSGIDNFQSGFFHGPSNKELFHRNYIPLINRITDKMLSNDYDHLMEEILLVSKLQLQLFPDLFTPEIRLTAQRGVDTGEYAIKLCGSGGGGFYLEFQRK